MLSAQDWHFTDRSLTGLSVEGPSWAWSRHGDSRVERESACGSLSHGLSHTHTHTHTQTQTSSKRHRATWERLQRPSASFFSTWVLTESPRKPWGGEQNTMEPSHTSAWQGFRNQGLRHQRTGHHPVVNLTPLVTLVHFSCVQKKKQIKSSPLECQWPEGFSPFPFSAEHKLLWHSAV